MNLLKHNMFGFLKSYIGCLISFCISVYCYFNPVCQGLELLFLLPLSYGISLLLLPRAHSFWNANIGFVILFVSIWIKYLVTPILMTISHSTVNTLHPSAASLRYSSILAVFELYAVLIIVQHQWTRYLLQIESTNSSTDYSRDTPHAGFRLYWTGFVFLAALLALVVMRGHLVGVFSQLSTWFRHPTDSGDIYSYDLIAFEVIKTGIVLLLISYFARLYYTAKNKSTKVLFFLCAFAIAVINTMYFQYDQRTGLTQLILATLYMFLSFFPQHKGIVIPVGVIFGIGLVVLIFLDGSLNYSIGDAVSTNMITELSKMSELYVSGPTVVAKTLDTISDVRSMFSIETIWSDIIHSMNFLSMLPFTRWIFNTVRNIPTSNELFKYSIGGFAYILPNYTFACYYASEFLGWLLEILLIWLTIKIIYWIECRKKEHNDAMYYYAFVYFEIILGQAIFVNNFRLLWHAFSNLPIWLLIFAYVNSLGKRITFKR